MHWIDWLVVILFVAASLAIGLYFTKKASKGKEDFFLAGRSLGWFVAGTSIVATTFSSDTPQWVAGVSRDQGISGNWLWWCAAIGQIGAIFFLARYWRRSEVVTEVDFVQLRYGDSRSSKALRVFKSLFDGLLVNCTIMATVTLAMAKVTTIVLGLSTEPIFFLPIVGGVTWMAIILVFLTVFVLAYSALSGLYGVVYTDLFQFCFAMIGTMALAIIMYVDASSGEGLIHKLQAVPNFEMSMLNMIPDLSIWNVGTMLFLVYVGILWMMSFPTGGFHVQRLLSTKNENEATKAFLWYYFANYVLRSWPWIVVGMLAMVYFPDIKNPEDSYALAISQFLPVGLKGIMVASFLAAYMSTISTHLNWGTSYVVNDFYQAFINKQATSQNIVFVSRLCMVIMLVFAAVIATKITMMITAFQFLTQVWAGVGLVLIARWYWWRVSAATEFVCLAVTVILTAVLNIDFISKEFLESIHLSIGMGSEIKGWVIFGIRITAMTIIPPLLWIPFAFLSSSKPKDHDLSFYRKLRISSFGWSKVEKLTGVPSPKGEFATNFKGWFVTVICLYGLMLGIGSLLFHQWTPALGYLAAASISGYFLIGMMKRQAFSGLADKMEPENITNSSEELLKEKIINS
ncbi:MAG: Na+:solute symporter [Lentisphaerales bacterium]|nr:Na+:solute symporter [Lentisphaerales bacterium]